MTLLLIVVSFLLSRMLQTLMVLYAVVTRHDPIHHLRAFTTGEEPIPNGSISSQQSIIYGNEDTIFLVNRPI